MARVLNAHLIRSTAPSTSSHAAAAAFPGFAPFASSSSSADAPWTACESFSFSALVDLQRALLPALDPSLNGVFAARPAEGRWLAAFGEVWEAEAQVEQDEDEGAAGDGGGDADEAAAVSASAFFEPRWAAEAALHARLPPRPYGARLRDAKCHELAMHWAHHVPDARKRELAQLLPALPLLPARPPAVRDGVGGDERSADDADAVVVSAADAAALEATVQQATYCLPCHVDGARGGDDDGCGDDGDARPEPTAWPTEFTMTTNITGGTFADFLVQVRMSLSSYE